MPSSFDVIVLTAANATQARGYEAQLAAREKQGLLPKNCVWRVVADPGGRRVGSGTSTLAVLLDLAQNVFAGENFVQKFAHKRVLIAHSGGDARRLPAYAAQGKIFLPLPCDVPTQNGPARPATLFDLLLQTLAQIPRDPDGEIVCCSGDVLLAFDPTQVPLEAHGGVAGLGFAAAPGVGTGHGVFLTPNPSVGGVVTDFLQKPSLELMQQRGAIDATGRILVDTGVFGFSPRAAGVLLEAAGCSVQNGIGDGLFRDVLEGRVALVDLYQEIALALPLGVPRERYLAEISGANRTTAASHSLGRFFDQIRAAGLAFSVAAVSDGEFFHVGATRDLLWKWAEPSRTARRFSFQNGHRSPAALEHDALRAGLTIFNACGHLDALKNTGAAFFEGGNLEKSLQLAGDNVVVGFDGSRELKLPPGVGLAVLPVEIGSEKADVPILFGHRDDNKTPLENGGLWLNRPLGEWNLGQIWPGVEKTAWTLPVWRTGEDGWQVVETLLAEKTPETAINAFSLADLLALVDHDELLRRRDELAGQFDAARLFDSVQEDSDFPIAERLATLPEKGNWPQRFAARLEEFLKTEAPPLERARLMRAAALIEEKAGKTSPWNRAAFSEVARAVESSLILPHEPREAAILHDQAVWATAPARLDFAGGWSDTPPICLERGGTVLNAAVTLNGQYPVQVVAKLNDEGCIRLTSIDLGRQEIFRDASQINGPPDLGQWSSLAKAALVLTGIVPEAGQGDLGNWLQTLGGGLDLTLFSGLPKGSGMGTSSVLGATTLACLSRVLGHEPTHADLIAQTSLLEQRLTSGGGWQDQVGGIVAGVKLIRTAPGLEQIPSLGWTIFGPTGAASQGLQRRMLLYFTGQKRLAANILQHVVGRYLAREREVLSIIERLKAGAEAAKSALEANDQAAFAARVEEYWNLKKAIDPGSTNAEVEAILARVQKYTSARLLCGAGGGGFMLLIARDAEAADRIRLKLSDDPPNPHARFFDFAIDGRGLEVTVL